MPAFPGAGEHSSKFVDVRLRIRSDRYSLCIKLRSAICIEHGEMIAHRVCLAVANDHAKCLARWNPGANPGFHSRLGQTNLISWTVIGVRVSIGWHPTLVGAPTHFGGSDTFFIEAFD